MEYTMTPTDLTRTVACATGESMTTIRRCGLGIADPLVVHHDPQPRRWRRLATGDPCGMDGKGDAGH